MCDMSKVEKLNRHILTVTKLTTGMYFCLHFCLRIFSSIFQIVLFVKATRILLIGTISRTSCFCWHVTLSTPTTVKSIHICRLIMVAIKFIKID